MQPMHLQLDVVKQIFAELKVFYIDTSTTLRRFIEEVVGLDWFFLALPVLLMVMILLLCQTSSRSQRGH